MKIKNLVITSLVTGAIALSTTAGNKISLSPIKVEAASYTQSQNYEVMYYFTNNVRNNVEKYLDKDLTSTNLNKLLEYYDTLYDYVKNGKYVKNTYFRNLEYYEQDELNSLLTNWGNEIYNLYKNKSYFKTNCKNKLGFYLNYNSQETGYDREHDQTLEYYTETLNNNLETYLDKGNSQINLKSALDVYNKLVKFVKGSTRSYGYIFSELTITEQQEIINLLENWTYSIENEYENYSYYKSNCISKIGWTVNTSNLYNELEEYIGNTNGYIQNTPTYPNYSTSPSIPSTQTPSIPQQIPTTPNIGNNGATTPGNNTIAKDWRESYIDPSINTSRGERDWTPENIDEIYNTNDNYWRYTQDYNGNYYQNNNYNQNGYYDYYGNFIPYYQNQNGYYNEDGYVEDYVPTYIYR